MAWCIMSGMANLEWLFLQSGSRIRTLSEAINLCLKLGKLKSIRLDGSNISRSEYRRLVFAAPSLDALDSRKTRSLGQDGISPAIKMFSILKEVRCETSNPRSLTQSPLDTLSASQLTHLDLSPSHTKALVQAPPSSLMTFRPFQEQHYRF